MNRRWCSLIIAVYCCLLLTISVHAQTYTIGDTDLTLNIDDTYWYVFTRDNIKNNSELIDFGVTYDYMYDFFMNNKVYVDAILYYEDDTYLELFVRKTSIDDIINLSEYDDSDVRSLAKALADKRGTTNYTVYSSKYKFVRLEYSDQGFYLCEYYTVVNGDNYTFTFQSAIPFSASKYSDVQDVIDSVNFRIDTSLSNKKSGAFGEDLLDAFISGAVLAAIFGGGAFLIKRKKNNEVKVQDIFEPSTKQSVSIKEHESQISCSAAVVSQDNDKLSLSPENEEPGYGYVPRRDIGIHDELAAFIQSSPNPSLPEYDKQSVVNICPNCKNEIPKDSKFCQYCGHKQDFPIKDALFCRECGNKLVEGDSYCNICGAKSEDTK